MQNFQLCCWRFVIFSCLPMSSAHQTLQENDICKTWVQISSSSTVSNVKNLPSISRKSHAISNNTQLDNIWEGQPCTHLLVPQVYRSNGLLDQYMPILQISFTERIFMSKPPRSYDPYVVICNLSFMVFWILSLKASKALYLFSSAADGTVWIPA